jgi:hypothetical protein
MLKTVEGIYQNGQIELTELPKDVSDRTQFSSPFSILAKSLPPNCAN